MAHFANLGKEEDENKYHKTKTNAELIKELNEVESEY